MDPLNATHRDDMPVQQPAGRTAQPDGAAASDLDSNPRYCVHQFRSAASPGDRLVFVYLPVQYMTDPERRFPVLYLQDGQNLFDERISYISDKTWHAHTTADRLNEEHQIEPVILVGVANAGLRRLAEYTPTRDSALGGGEGPGYARLLMGELMPFIDHTYRTLDGPLNTGVGGSSLGGLISLYLGFLYPATFGKVAALSPSIWWDHRSIFRCLEDANPPAEARIWLDTGVSEGQQQVRDTALLHRELLRHGWRDNSNLHYLKAEDGGHDEKAWASRFGEVLRFLFPPAGTDVLR